MPTSAAASASLIRSPILATISPCFLSSPHDSLFVYRQQFGPDLDAEVPADRVGGAPVVTGQRYDLDARIGQGFEPGLGIGARLVAHGDQTGNPVARQQH